MLGLANIFRTAARVGIFLIGVVMVSFTIFSGALNYGITIGNILRHLPDAIPWFLLLFTLFIAWDYELIGGIIILFLGVGGIFYMQSANLANMPQYTVMFGIIVFAISFILSWFFRQINEVSYT